MQQHAAPSACWGATLSPQLDTGGRQVKPLASYSYHLVSSFSLLEKSKMVRSQGERLNSNLELLQKLEKMKGCLEEGRYDVGRVSV